MIKGKWKLLICTILVTCVLFMASNSVFAAINEDYYNENMKDNVVSEHGLDNILSNSILTDALGHLIYGIAWLLERLLGVFFNLVTGSNFFPWADAILFNAVPFLDINVFNPSGASLLAIVQEFIAGTYYTVLTLASAFFGVAVMVTAIKLVLTAIAEDKARYKKAIVDWLLGLVMLWGIHFFISFALYLNEELVEVASQIATNSVKSSGKLIQQLADTSDANSKIIANFVNLMENGGVTLGSVLGVIAKLIGVIIIVIAVVGVAVSGGWAAVGLAAAIKAGASIAVGGAVYIAGAAYNIKQLWDEVAVDFTLLATEHTYEAANKFKDGDDIDYDDIKKWLFTQNDTFTYVDNEGKKYTYNYSPIDVASNLLKSEVYQEIRGFKDLAGADTFWTLGTPGDRTHVKLLFFDANQIVGDMKVCPDFGKNCNESEQITTKAIDFYKFMLNMYDNMSPAEQVKKGDDKNYDENLHKLYRIYVNIFDSYVVKQASETNVITNLAAYFKETAWSTSETGWKANKSVIQNALMYAILVVQSLIFFIAYVKRLFYVIMLILMAPIVVVMDFFTKFGN